MIRNNSRTFFSILHKIVITFDLFAVSRRVSISMNFSIVNESLSPLSEDYFHWKVTRNCSVRREERIRRRKRHSRERGRDGEEQR